MFLRAGMAERERERRKHDHGRRCGARGAREEPLNAAAEEQHDERIEQQQRKRGEEDRSAQILRLAGAVDVAACALASGEKSSGASRSAAASVFTASRLSGGP